MNRRSKLNSQSGVLGSKRRYRHLKNSSSFNSNSRFLLKIDGSKCPQKDLHKNFHSSFVPKGPPGEELCGPAVGEHTGYGPHTMGLYSDTHTHTQHRQVPEHYTEWKKPCVRIEYGIFPFIWSSRTCKLIFAKKNFMISPAHLGVESVGRGYEGIFCMWCSCVLVMI